jgi:hypothetical protein
MSFLSNLLSERELVLLPIVWFSSIKDVYGADNYATTQLFLCNFFAILIIQIRKLQYLDFYKVILLRMVRAINFSLGHCYINCL